MVSPVRFRASPSLTALDRHLRDDPLRLFDVGARGGFHERWDRFRPYLDVTGFEPDPVECERLNREATSLPYRSRYLPHALDRVERTGATFHVCEWEVASSIYEPNAELLESFPYASRLFAVRERRPIDTTTLDAVCDEHGARPDCLKLDVQGAELDVIAGGERAVDAALVLETEVEFAPLYRGQPLFADLDAHLRQRGWWLLGLRRNAWRRTAGVDRARNGDGGQVIYGDALYVNGRALEAAQAAARMVKLLVILAAYRQFDLFADLLEGAAGGLAAADRDELRSELAPGPGRLRRLASRLGGRLTANRRRALADSLQRGDATVWEDPGFF